MTSNALLDLLGWAEAAVFALAALATAIYVIVKVVASAIRCGSASRVLALVAAAVIFLLLWGGLAFAGVVATIMAVVSDVQASPAGNEHWRQLSVLGCAAAVMVGVGLVAAWLARRVCDAAVGRRIA